MLPRARLAGFYGRLSASLTESLRFEPGVVLDVELAEARSELATARDALAVEVGELKEGKRRFAVDLGEFLDALLHGGFGWDAVAARLCPLAKQGNPVAQTFARAFGETGAHEQGERAAVAHERERTADRRRVERCS